MICMNFDKYCLSSNNILEAKNYSLSGYKNGVKVDSFMGANLEKLTEFCVRMTASLTSTAN